MIWGHPILGNFHMALADQPTIQMSIRMVSFQVTHGLHSDLAGEFTHFFKRVDWELRTPTVMARVIPVISTKKTPFRKCIYIYNPTYNQL